MGRLTYIDQLKAFSIFLIVYGHNDYFSQLNYFFLSFRLPLFFIISGYLTKDKKDMTLSFFFNKYGKRLLIPYFSVAIFLYIFWFFIGRHYGASAEASYSPLKNLVGILYAQGGPDYMNWGGPLWFLPALFSVLFIDLLVAKAPVKLRPFIVIIISLIGYLMSEALNFRLPWSIDVAMVVYLFFYAGKLFKNFKLHKLNSKFKWLFVVIPLLLHLFLMKFYEPTVIYQAKYGLLLLTYFIGIIGFIWLFTLFQYLPDSTFVIWVGQNTLPILTFHLFILTLIKGFALFVFNIELNFTILNSFLITFLQLIVLTPLIIFLNRHCRFMVGKA